MHHKYFRIKSKVQICFLYLEGTRQNLSFRRFGSYWIYRKELQYCHSWIIDWVVQPTFDSIKKYFAEQMEHTFIPQDFNTFKQGLQFQYLCTQFSVYTYDLLHLLKRLCFYIPHSRFYFNKSFCRHVKKPSSPQQLKPSLVFCLCPGVFNGHNYAAWPTSTPAALIQTTSVWEKSPNSSVPPAFPGTGS